MERFPQQSFSANPFLRTFKTRPPLNLEDELSNLEKLYTAISGLKEMCEIKNYQFIYSHKIRRLVERLKFTQEDITPSANIIGRKLNAAYLQVSIENQKSATSVLKDIQLIKAVIKQKIRLDQETKYCRELRQNFEVYLLQKTDKEVLRHSILKNLKNFDGINGQHGIDYEILKAVVYQAHHRDIEYRHAVFNLCIEEGLSPEYGNKMYREETMNPTLFSVLLNNYETKFWDDKTFQGFELIRMIGSWQPALLNEKYLLQGRYETPLHKVARLGSITLFYLLLSLQSYFFYSNGTTKDPCELLIQKLKANKNPVTLQDLYSIFAFFTDAQDPEKYEKFREPKILNAIRLHYQWDDYTFLKLLKPISILIGKLIQQKTILPQRFEAIIDELKHFNILASYPKKQSQNPNDLGVFIDIGHELLLSVVRNIRSNDIQQAGNATESNLNHMQYRTQLLQCCIEKGLRPYYQKRDRTRLSSGATILHTLLSNYQDWKTWQNIEQGEGLRLLWLLSKNYPPLLTQRFIDCNSFINTTPLHEAAQCSLPLPLYASLVHYLLKNNAYEESVKKTDFLGKTPGTLLLHSIKEEDQLDTEQAKTRIETKLREYINYIQGEESSVYTPKSPTILKKP